MSLLEIEDIKRDFRLGSGVLHVLKDINLTIEKGEYVAPMGPSRSGKSTSMSILGCLDTPTSREYILNGKDVSKMSDAELADVRSKEIGFIFQILNLMPRTAALDNVALPMVYAGVSREKRHERAREVLKMVSLEDRVLYKPNELSGGQRQWVAVARALVNHPPIILADEPTGNLDSKTSCEIMNLFDEIYQKGNTMILVTHEEDIAQYAHRIVRLKGGLVETGNAKN